MIRCLFIKRKLYDYLDNSLSEIERIKVESHLDICNKCSQGLAQLKGLLDAVSRKNLPQPNNEFWHNFKVDLDRKLNEKLVPPIKLKPGLSYHLKPAFAYLFALIFILVVGKHLYKRPYSASLRIAQNENLNENLEDEIEALDEADTSSESELGFDDDPYMEELYFLYELDEV